MGVKTESETDHNDERASMLIPISKNTSPKKQSVSEGQKEKCEHGPLEYWVLEFITSLYEDTIDEAHSLHNELSLCWWISVNDILEKHDTVFALVYRM